MKLPDHNANIINVTFIFFRRFYEIEDFFDMFNDQT